MTVTKESGPSGATLRGRIIGALIVSAIFIISTLAVTSYHGQQQLLVYLASAQCASDKSIQVQPEHPTPCDVA